jgi:hypothetical protein
LKEAWDDLLLEAFSCQVWSLSVLLERLQASPGSPELQNGGLIALGEACDEFLIGMLYEFSWR